MVGEKRHLVTLETRSTALDAYGDATLTYAELARVWGELKAVSARERLEAQQVKADITHKLIVRQGAAYAALGADDRVTLGTRTFDIVGPPIDPDGRGREWQLTVLERR